MTLRVARLALPFTDSDISSTTRDIRVYNTDTSTAFTVSVALPSVSGVSNGYYNGGDLGTADTSTYTLPGESLVMAVCEAIAAHGSGFDITVAEGDLPGYYVLTRKDVNQWELRWGDPLTTFEPQWLGFAAVTYTSATQVITAPYQADRLWIAHRPTWNRVREHKKTAMASTWSGGHSSRQISGIRKEYELKYSAQPGPRIYKYDGSLSTLVALVPDMTIDDPNIALESLWAWIAARTPVQYWYDETDLTSSIYLRPSQAGELDGVIRTIRAERSNTPPVYDVVMNFTLSTAGSAGVGGGGVICGVVGTAIHLADTYGGLPGGVSDGSLGKVAAGTTMAGYYRYVASVDGDTLGMWLPADDVQRGLGYGTDASGYHSRISTGIGSDTDTILTARGWVDGSAGTGSVTTVGGDIKMTAGGAGTNFAALTFTPVVSAPKDFLIVAEMDTTNAWVGGSLPYYGCFWRATHTWICLAADAANTASFMSSSTVLDGAGKFVFTPFNRIFIRGTWLPGASDWNISEMWGANADDSGKRCGVESPVSGTDIIFIYSRSSTGNPSYLIRELHFFEVG